MSPRRMSYRANMGSDEVKEFVEKVIQVNRVSKKTKGGNKIGFSVLVVVGDRQGKVGVGLGKAPDVSGAIKKGVNYARKRLITIPLKGTTITHEIVHKSGAAKIFLKPASQGTGVIAGGSVRAVVEAAGVRDILSKVLGTSNKASNVYATLEALKKLKSRPAKKTESVQPEPETPKVKQDVKVLKAPQVEVLVKARKRRTKKNETP